MRGKVTSLRHLIGELTTEIAMLSEVIAELLAGYPGYRAIQALPGIGPCWAAVIVAEIGDISRFATAARLCCWAGLTPRRRQSDLKVIRDLPASGRSRWVDPIYQRSVFPSTLAPPATNRP